MAVNLGAEMSSVCTCKDNESSQVPIQVSQVLGDRFRDTNYYINTC